MSHTNYRIRLGALSAVLAATSTTPALALDELSFTLRNSDDSGLEKTLRDASLLVAAEDEGRTNPNDLVATALAEYERLVTTLYAQGYYGGVVKVKIDGVEAASIQNFDIPDRISRIDVEVVPAQQFTFGTAVVRPMPQGAEMVDGFASGEIAYSTVVQDAAADAIDQWRAQGRAKAEIADQDIVANHRTDRLNARIVVNPGPVVAFGTLEQRTQSDVRAERIQRIAGLPTGERFSPEALEKSAERLRRTGAFASVAMREGDLNADHSMDILLNVADMRPRRYGFGAEISSLEGAGLSAFWMHRNLMGGAERFRVDAEASGITPNFANLDLSLAARLDIPAAFGTDTDAYVLGEAEMLREPTYEAWTANTEVGAHRYFTDTIEGSIGAGYTFSRVTDSQGTRNFSLVSLPTSAIWDRRDNELNATRGSYVGMDVEPFYEFTYGAGAWANLDARAYKGFGANDRFVVAARVQAGTVLGPTAANTHPDYLFYSGGGGTVRGQDYQSLTFPAGGGAEIGGQAFAGAQLELRVKATEQIGIVGFYDIGYLGAESFTDTNSKWHSGAGLGLRYDTGIGPIRLDVGLPVQNGGASDGLQFRDVQIYVGIGQSF